MATSVDEVVEKIRKIIRLARKAGTDGERKAAENAAKRLADAHGVALDTIECPDAEPTKNVVMHDAKYRTRTGVEMGYACATIRDHFGVVVVENIGERGKVFFSWVGARINIEIAQHAFAILLRESRAAWKEVSGLGLKKDSFMKGWFLCIYKKLLEHPLRNDLDQFEYEKKTALDFYRKQTSEDGELAGAGEAKVSKKGIDADSLEEGYEKAKRVSLNRPCGHDREQDVRGVTKVDAIDIKIPRANPML